MLLHLQRCGLTKQERTTLTVLFLLLVAFAWHWCTTNLQPRLFTINNTMQADSFSGGLQNLVECCIAMSQNMRLASEYWLVSHNKHSPSSQLVTHITTLFTRLYVYLVRVYSSLKTQNSQFIIIDWRMIIVFPFHPASTCQHLVYESASHNCLLLST